MTHAGGRAISWMAAALIVGLPLFVSGCGTQPRSFTAGSGSIRKNPKYKSKDADLVKSSNSIPTYSTPDAATRTMKRAPDQVVDDGNGVATHFYNADDSTNAERLQLRYKQNHLIGKQIIPPNTPNGAIADSRASAPPRASDSANYVDVREYDPKARRYDPMAPNTPADNANATFNSSFNEKLNATVGKRY